MTARDGGSALITDIRRKTNSGTADYSTAGVTYWTDDQIQDELDKRRHDVYREIIYPADVLDPANEQYDFYLQHCPVEGTVSGTVWFVVTDSVGSVVTNYTLEQFTGRITFDSDTDDNYYVDYKWFDLERTAASIWRDKAAYYASEFDISSDNHSLKRSQKVSQAMAMADYWERSAKPMVVRMKRRDVLK